MSLNRVLALALLCAGLTACASDPGNPARAAKTAEDLYPLHAELRPDQVALAVHADGLSEAQVEALTALAVRWRDARSGPVVLAFPGKTDPQVVARLRSAAAQVLTAQGVAAAVIRVKTYDSVDAAAPLLVSFSRYEAVTPHCGLAWDDLTATEDNNVQPNFGCEISANMAAQIANPADIVHPRAEDEPNASHRAAMMTAYSAGKKVGSDDGASSAISRAVN
jgi:pilus assembly protein CpaD